MLPDSKPSKLHFMKTKVEVPFARELKDFEAFRAVVKPHAESRN